MELIKLNDKLSILINQDNCSAAKARSTSQTAVMSKTFWPNRTQCCAESHYIDILMICLSGALAFSSTFTVCPLISVKTKLLLEPSISIFVNDLGISSLLNCLVCVCWYVQSSRHLTCHELMSILSKFICLHSFSWIRNCIKLMQIKSYIASQFVSVN